MLSQEQLAALDACPALAGMKEWFLAVDELIEDADDVAEDPVADGE